MSSSNASEVLSMEVSSQEERAPPKISFGVKKKIESLVIKPEEKASIPVLDISDDSDEEREAEEEERAAKRRKLTHVENGLMPENEEDVKKKAKLVIPMVMEVDWRIHKLLEQEKAGTITDADRARLALLTQAQSFTASDKEGGDAIVVEEKTEKETEDADYEQVSVEGFGLAILRGCGWKDGDGIGKNPQVVPLRLPERRAKGLGLGAAPKTERKKGKSGEKGEDFPEEVNTGSCIKITQGQHKGAYAKVESRDDDNSSLFVRLALGGRSVRVSLFSVYAVGQKEFERDGKCINKDNYDKEKEKIEKRKEGMRSKKEEKNEKDGIEKKKAQSRSAVEDEMWARVDLVVRVVCDEYRKGRHLDEKMQVMDAADRKNITLLDENGRTHYNMRQSWIETVIPRHAGESVMIVKGKWRGEKAVMEDKNKQRCLVHARLLRTQEMVKVDFDDVCSWKPRVIEEDDL